MVFKYICNIYGIVFVSHYQYKLYCSLSRVLPWFYVLLIEEGAPIGTKMYSRQAKELKEYGITDLYNNEILRQKRIP